jgi:hypothetical protein
VFLAPHEFSKFQNCWLFFSLGRGNFWFWSRTCYRISTNSSLTSYFGLWNSDLRELRSWWRHRDKMEYELGWLFVLSSNSFSDFPLKSNSGLWWSIYREQRTLRDQFSDFKVRKVGPSEAWKVRFDAKFGLAIKSYPSQGEKSWGIKKKHIKCPWSHSLRCWRPVSVFLCFGDCVVVMLCWCVQTCWWLCSWSTFADVGWLCWCIALMCWWLVLSVLLSGVCRWVCCV